jgi:hypothetical protein
MFGVRREKPEVRIDSLVVPKISQHTIRDRNSMHQKTDSDPDSDSEPIRVRHGIFVRHRVRHKAVIALCLRRLNLLERIFMSAKGASKNHSRPISVWGEAPGLKHHTWQGLKARSMEGFCNSLRRAPGLQWLKMKNLRPAFRPALLPQSMRLFIGGNPRAEPF